MPRTHNGNPAIQFASRQAAAAALISECSWTGMMARVVNFRNGVHGKIVFAKSVALAASMSAIPPPPSARLWKA